MIRRWRSGAVLLIVAAVAIALAACGDSGGEEFPSVVMLGEGEIYPSVSNSSLAPGLNRLVMRLSDADGEPVLGADVHLRFYDLNGDEPAPAFEADARFVPVQLGYVDEQSGGTREETGSSGAYIAYVTFARAGDWGVKVRATVDGEEMDEAPFRFTVLEKSIEPALGEEAPRSRQATLADVPDVSEIDSSSPARPAMHDTAIADAVTSGQPSVIAFATPAFCTSRLCAPIMDTVMDPLAARYAGQAHFIHVEPYLLRDLRSGFVQNPVPATLEWRIPSEPWIFVVDREGKVAAKFEGVVALDEVEAALQEALG